MVSAAGGGSSSMALDMTKPGKFQIAITAVNDKGIDAVKEKYILLVENDEYVPEEPSEQFLYISTTTDHILKGQLLNLSITSANRLNNAYLQFDDGSGNWLSEEYCAQNSAFIIHPYSFTHILNRHSYTKSLAINTPGSAELDYARKVRVVDVAEDGTISISNELTFYVYGEDAVYSDALVSVTPVSGMKNDDYTFTAVLDILPAQAYLVFDNPSSADWLSDEFCMQYFTVDADEYSYDAASGECTIEKVININTAGVAHNDYARRVKLVYLDETYERYETAESVFRILDEAAGIAPVVSSVDYEFKADTLVFHVTTTDADTVRIYNGHRLLGTADRGYTASGNQYVWEIPVDTEKFTDKKLTFRGHSIAYGENSEGITLTVPSEEAYSLGKLKITAPVEPAAVIIGDAVTLKWNPTAVSPDRYEIQVSCEGTEVYTTTVSGDSNNCQIPGTAFAGAGRYSVELTAEKEGYTESKAILSIMCSEEEIKQDGKNPTKQEVYDFVVEYLTGLNYTNNEHFSDLIDVCCSMLWKESTYRHFVNGEINKNENGGDKGTDWGISMINDNRDNWKDIKHKVLNPDWKVAAAFGINILLQKYFEKGVYNAAVAGKDKMNYTLEEAWAAAAYATYNATDPERFYKAKDGRDTAFMVIYRTKPWLSGVSTNTVNELLNSGKVDYVTGVVLNVEELSYPHGRVPIYAKTTSAIDEQCGWIDIGDTVYIEFQKDGYYLVSTKTKGSGYVKMGYIEASAAVKVWTEDMDDEEPKEEVIPTDEFITETICDASQYTDVIVGDSVTFKVYASEGSHDFKIKINNLDAAEVSAEFKDVLIGKDYYEVKHTFLTTGDNSVLITWIDADGNHYSAKSKWNITVELNAKDWTSYYLNGELYIGYKEDIGTLNEYGLYVMKNGVFSDETIYGKNTKDKPIAFQHSTWDISTDLDNLEADTYEYGVISRAANSGCGYVTVKLGEFTVEEAHTYREKTMYVISRDGADVYGGFSLFTRKPKDKFTDIRLQYNAAVIVLDGGEKNGYYLVRVTRGNTEVEAYVAKDCLGEKKIDPAVEQEVIDDSSPKSIEEAFEQLKKEYPHGSYFTTTKKSCDKDENDKDIISCHDILSKYLRCVEGGTFTDVNGVYGTPGKIYQCTCMNSFTIGSGQTAEKIELNSSQCLGYARYVYYNLFEMIDNTSKSYDVLSGKTFKFKQLIDNDVTDENVEELKQLIIGHVLPGAHVRLNSLGERQKINKDYSEKYHSLSIEKYDNEKIVVLQCNNTSNDCEVTENVYTWKEFYKKYNNYYYIEYIMQPIEYPYDLSDIYTSTYTLYSNNNSQDSLVNNVDTTNDGFTTVLELFDVFTPSGVINTITASTSVATSFEVASRTGSISVEIPHEPATQTVEIRQGGRIYGNGEEILFSTPRLVFDVALIENYGGAETVYTFDLTKKDPIDECDINTIYATFYNDSGEVVGSDIIRDFTDRSIDVPYSTAKAVFSHASDGNYSYIRYATEETLEHDRFLPKDIAAVVDDDADTFTLAVHTDAGTEVSRFDYTLNRLPKSSAANLYALEVSAYDADGEMIGTHDYPSDSSVEITLPYSTETIDLIAPVSAFADKICYLNDTAISSLNEIHVQDGDTIRIDVIAEDGTTAEYLIYLSINAEPDTLAPVITVTSTAGKAYADGDTISGVYLVSLTDDSWCWYTLYHDGEEVEDVEITADYSLTEYTIEACDVFGNISTFTFKYLVDPTVIEVVPGDVNGDGIVSAKDAQYLADHLTAPEEYPVDTDILDFNRDGEVTQADALYLLRHTILPERYPLPR